MDFLSKPEVVSMKFEIALGSLNDKKEATALPAFLPHRVFYG